MSAELMQLLMGYRATQAIHVAAALGIPDLLAAGRGTSDALARGGRRRPRRALPAPAHSGGDRRPRGGRRARLRADAARRAACAPTSPARCTGGRCSSAAPQYWRSWGNLEHSIRTGENSFRALHGTDIWEWRAARPEESAIFDGAMRSLTGASNDAILAAYDFGRFDTIVDVAGGSGALLAAILGAHPHARGVLFDQQHVVDGAAPVLAAVADRVDIVAGSFFDAVPVRRRTPTSSSRSSTTGRTRRRSRSSASAEPRCRRRRRCS